MSPPGGGSDEEWDGVDQQGKPHSYCTDHATIELTRLASCDLRVRISPMHLLADLLEQRPDIDAGEYLQSTNPTNRNCDMTQTECAMRKVFLPRMLWVLLLTAASVLTLITD